MANTASELFDFLERRDSGVIERHEIGSVPFSELRRYTRQIALCIRDSSDPIDQELSVRFRRLICEWLTSPVSFPGMREDLLGILPPAEAVGSRWEPDLRKIRNDAATAAEELLALESPLRHQLREAIKEARKSGLIFRIFCHPRAQSHFESIMVENADTRLEASDFLHSVREYRDADLFDMLIKVGPLRASGWGSIPDAVLNAPRFCSLVQFVWTGCNDEAGFGYDPAASFADPSSSSPNSTVDLGRVAPGERISWNRHVTHFGETPDSNVDKRDDFDDLRVFGEVTIHADERAAILIQVDADHGMLYSPHSQILSFDPNPCCYEPISWRIPGETLHQGMYVAVPIVSNVDLGSVRADHGGYSRIWKDQLLRERDLDAFGLYTRLVDEGIDLEHLNGAIDHWCRPPTTVIHAPKRIKHFEMLLRVLGFGDRVETGPNKKRVAFWRLAWDEVRRSRGEAIQAGVQEHEIVDEELHGILVKLLPEIRKTVGGRSQFEVAIPASNDIKGTFQFTAVSGIQEGFSAPDSALKVVLSLKTIEQWRD